MGVKIRTGKAAGRGGWLLMPLRENVPDPGDGEWQLSSCPECGRECWSRRMPEGFTEEPAIYPVYSGIVSVRLQGTSAVVLVAEKGDWPGDRAGII